MSDNTLRPLPAFDDPLPPKEERWPFPVPVLPAHAPTSWDVDQALARATLTPSLPPTVVVVVVGDRTRPAEQPPATAESPEQPPTMAENGNFPKTAATVDGVHKFLNSYGREQRNQGRIGIKESEFRRAADGKFDDIPVRIWRPAYRDVDNKQGRGAPKKSVK
jgi:hypothetical protein